MAIYGVRRTAGGGTLAEIPTSTEDVLPTGIKPLRAYTTLPGGADGNAVNTKVFVPGSGASSGIHVWDGTAYVRPTEPIYGFLPNGTTVEVAGVQYRNEGTDAAQDWVAQPLRREPLLVQLDSTSPTFQIPNPKDGFILDCHIYVDTSGGPVGDQETLPDGTLQARTGNVANTIVAALWPTDPKGEGRVSVTMFDAVASWGTTNVSLYIGDHTANGITIPDKTLTYVSHQQKPCLVQGGATNILAEERPIMTSTGGGSTTDIYVNETGDTMTGPLDMSGNPIDNAMLQAGTF